MRMCGANKLILLMTALLAVVVMPRCWGQERAREKVERPQVDAATTEAISSLRDAIERASINRHVTVGEFLRRTGGGEDLSRALARAELVGGPRWVDADTCQVQLEMSGPRIVRIL